MKLLVVGQVLAVALASTMLAGEPAQAGSADITLASTSDGGVKGNDGSFDPSISANGTRVALWSNARNLDPGDTDTTADVYVKDLVTGNITLASTSDAAVKGNGGSFDPSISADGTKVAFWSNATNLDVGDTDTTADVYVKDLVTGNITLASTSDAGVKGNEGGANPALSGDGKKVTFYSFATNLDPADTDFTNDVYVKDLVTGDITLASTSDAGVKGNGNSQGSYLSADGNVVAFMSEASNLDPGDTDTIADAYVKNLLTGEIMLASTTDAGIKGNLESVPSSLSGDGSVVALWSNGSNLDPADTDSIADAYVKNLATGNITLVSSSDAGVKGNGSSFEPSLSADGTKVAFWSAATNLDPGDTSRRNDIYVKDVSTGDIMLASTSAAGVRGNGDSTRPSLSSGGSEVAFLSLATNLDPADTDPSADIYIKALAQAADLSLTTTDTPDPATTSTRIKYTITIRNLGPDAATDVTLTDQLPAPVTFLSAQPSQGTCTQAGGIVTCDLGSLAFRGRATVTVRVMPNGPPGVITNTADIAADEGDPNPSNNHDSEATTVQ